MGSEEGRRPGEEIPPELSAAHQHEQRRFVVLERVYQYCKDDPCTVSGGSDLVRELGLGAAEFYRIVEFLSQEGYIEYLGAGPHLRITRRGRAYIERERGRRESVR